MQRFMLAAKPLVELRTGRAIKVRAPSVQLEKCDDEYVLGFEESFNLMTRAWLLRFNNEITKVSISPPE